MIFFQGGGQQEGRQKISPIRFLKKGVDGFSNKLLSFRDDGQHEIRQSILSIRILEKDVGGFPVNYPLTGRYFTRNPSINFPYTLSWKGCGETILYRIKNGFPTKKFPLTGTAFHKKSLNQLPLYAFLEGVWGNRSYTL